MMAPLNNKLPPVMLPVPTLSDVNVPTLVILGCAFVVTVPAVVADVAAPVNAPTNVVDVTLVKPVTVVTVAPRASVVSPNTTFELAKRACAKVPFEIFDAFIAVTLAADPLSVPIKLLLVVLPVTDKLVNVPTLVMLGCAAVVTVPAVVADVAAPVNAPTNVVDVTLLRPVIVVVVVPRASVVLPSTTFELANLACAKVPLEIFDALIAVTLAADPLSVPIKLPLVVLPVTAKLLSVPTLVILGCAFVVTVAAVVAAPVNAPTNVFDVTLLRPVIVVVVVPRASVVSPNTTFELANLACAKVPLEIFDAFMSVTLAPDPLSAPMKFAADAFPVTVSAVNVPTEVMLGCAAVVTVPAVVAEATVPVTLAPGILVSPAPDPKYVAAVMLPDALTRPTLTLPVPFGVRTMLALAADV